MIKNHTSITLFSLLLIMIDAKRLFPSANNKVLILIWEKTPATIKSIKGYNWGIPRKSTSPLLKNALHTRLNPRFSFRIASRTIHKMTDPEKLKKTEYTAIFDFLGFWREKISRSKNPRCKRMSPMLVIAKSSVKTFLRKEMPIETAKIQIIGTTHILAVIAIKRHKMQNSSSLKKILFRRLTAAERNPLCPRLVPKSLPCTFGSTASMHSPTIIDKHRFL
uniref:Ser/thr protein phosphatase pp2c n=1 Tax=Encephalitozoon cuniculi TaxID=6035 RepID=M1K9M2_ENCCN|nr:ser/thr protein phosphatase pp2c [Encephalitozoon cuniculi]